MAGPTIEELDAMLGSEADLDADLAALETEMADGGPDTGPELEAGLRGAAQGATFNFGDEISAAMATPVQKAAEFFGLREEAPARTLTRGLDAPVDPRGEYAINRDIIREQNRAAQERAPGSYLTGEVGGALLTAPATGGLGRGVAQAALPKLGAKGVSRLGGVIEGVGTGLATGAGASEADVLSGDFATDVAAGGAMGAAFPLAFEGAGKAAKGVIGNIISTPEAHRKAADLARLRQAGMTPTEIMHAGRRRGGVARKAEEVEALAQLGRQEVLPEGATGYQKFREATRFPQKTDQALEDIVKGKEQANAMMEEINQRAADAGATVDGGKVAQDIRKLADRYKRSGQKGAEKIVADIEDVAQRMEGEVIPSSWYRSGKGGVMSMADARTERRILNEQLKLDSPLLAGEEGRNIYGAWRGEMLDSIKETLGPEDAKVWDVTNSLVSTGIDAADTALRKSAREAGHRVPTFHAGMGLLTGGAEGAGAGMATGAVLREVGDRSPGIKAAYGRVMEPISAAAQNIPSAPPAVGKAAQWLGQSISREEVSRRTPSAEERRTDLISQIAQSSQNPGAQRAAQAIQAAQQQPGIGGAVEYYKQAGTNPDFREEEEERNGTYSR
jgi:hypothetical protein